MLDPRLPKIITAFLRAVQARDIVAVLRCFADDARIVDGGDALRGDAMRRWADQLLADPALAFHPTCAVVLGADTTVNVLVHGNRPGVAAPARRDWRFTVDGPRIAALQCSPSREPDQPPAVAAFVRATNDRDIGALMALFADGSMVNDDLQERWGTDAIRDWATGDFIGQRVNIFPVGCVHHHGIAALTACIDGDFDHRGLPYPLMLTLYFSLDGGAIVQLIILRNQQ